MQTDFSKLFYFPRIFWIRDILSENQSLVHSQKRDPVPLNLSAATSFSCPQGDRCGEVQFHTAIEHIRS